MSQGHQESVPSVDEAEQRAREVEREIAQSIERAQKVEEWYSSTKKMSARGEAMRGRVSVEVNFSGVPTSVRIQDDALAEGATALEQAIMEALGAAARQIADLQRQSAEAMFGPESQTVAMLDADAQSRLGTMPPPQSPETQGWGALR